jgi:hypothetical protein
MPTYEVEVVIFQPMTQGTRRFLDAARSSANRILDFTGDDRSITLTVEATGMDRNEAVRAAAMEVAHVFPQALPEFVAMKQR